MSEAPRLSAADLQRWFVSAIGGDAVIYIVEANIVNCKADVIKAVRKAYNDGLIELVQRRVSPKGLGNAKYEYIAVKRRRVQPRSVTDLFPKA